MCLATHFGNSVDHDASKFDEHTLRWFLALIEDNLKLVEGQSLHLVSKPIERQASTPRLFTIKI